MILFKIAFRNLREHKTKTLIIGSLIALGITFLVAGNSIMDSINAGLENSYQNNYTGDYIVRAISEEEVEFMGRPSSIEVIDDYSGLVAEIEALDSVDLVTPVLSGFSTIVAEEEMVSFSMLWGIDVESYREMFPGTFIFTEGADLKPDEKGVVLAETIVDSIYEEYAIEVKVGDPILLSNINGTSGTKIREVVVRGIGYFENNTGMTDMISFVDPNTLRGLNGLTAAAYTAEAAVDTSDEEVLFGDAVFGGSLVTNPVSEEVSSSAVDFDNILGDTSVRDLYSVLDNDAWYFILIKGAEGVSIESLGLELSELTAGYGSGEYVVEDWLWGAGNVAEMTYGLQTIFNIIILVISVVAVIIIMNTLVISVTERIPEIGTIRSIGGQKSFVRKMIILETLMITITFGIVGILVGSGIILGLNIAGIQATSMILQILFGGSVLNPVISVSSLIFSLLIVGVIGVVSSLYPVSVALGITPVQAMQKQ